MLRGRHRNEEGARMRCRSRRGAASAEYELRVLMKDRQGVTGQIHCLDPPTVPTTHVKSVTRTGGGKAFSVLAFRVRRRDTPHHVLRTDTIPKQVLGGAG